MILFLLFACPKRRAKKTPCFFTDPPAFRKLKEKNLPQNTFGVQTAFLFIRFLHRVGSPPPKAKGFRWIEPVKDD